jgi:thiol-disulfide isomerase/thioredoxin
MKRAIGFSVTALVLAAAVAAGAAGQTAPAGDGPSAAAMLAKIQALKPPVVDRTKVEDEKYVASYLEQRKNWQQQVDGLIKQFYEKYPAHEQAVPLMTQRWLRMAQTGEGKAVLKETEGALPGIKDAKKRADVLFVRGAAAIMDHDAAAGQAATDAFIKEAPKDERGAELLVHQADIVTDSQAKAALLGRVVKEYPGSSEAKSAQGKVKQAEGVGKPFDLEFTDAISGKKISVQKDLKGKVVVVDFWATWCGPCVAEMPKNKEIYAQYKDKGVEFVGVSLDQAPPEGLKALKAFVAENGISWPQYYQGNYWQSEFSSGWGIDSIPAVFIVDKEGKLASVEARGQLETLIPALLKK